MTKKKSQAAAEESDYTEEELKTTSKEPCTDEQMELAQQQEDIISEVAGDLPNPPQSTSVVDPTLRRPRNQEQADTMAGVFHRDSELGSVDNKTIAKRSEELNVSEDMARAHQATNPAEPNPKE